MLNINLCIVIWFKVLLYNTHNLRAITWLQACNYSINGSRANIKIIIKIIYQLTLLETNLFDPQPDRYYHL